MYLRIISEAKIITSREWHTLKVYFLNLPSFGFINLCATAILYKFDDTYISLQFRLGAFSYPERTSLMTNLHDSKRTYGDLVNILRVGNSLIPEKKRNEFEGKHVEFPELENVK